MNEGYNSGSEEEKQAAESFVAPQTPETNEITPADQYGSDQQKELNDQLYEKTRESFWLEKHGLLEPPLANRVREASTAFLKKGGQRLLTAFGAAAALAGAAYLEKDQIIESIDTIMKSPVVTESLEFSWNQPFVIDTKDRLADSDVTIAVGKNDSTSNRLHELMNQPVQTLKMEREEHRLLDIPYATVNLKGTKIELEEEYSVGRLNDTGAKIELNDPYLQNLTIGPHSFLQPAANPHRFAEFVRQEAAPSLDLDKGYGSSNESFKSGNVGQFIDIANDIVASNLEYDDRTAAWLSPGRSGQTDLKWGGNNPFTAFLSSDSTPVDELLMNKKVGVCRHYAEALPMVCEELKRQNPGKFQNIYVTPLGDAYQMHEYDAIYVVTGPHQAKMFVFDPTAGKSKGSPSFDLFRTLYHRQIIDEDLFMKLSTEYFANGGHESWEDAAEFLNVALAEGDQEVLRGCKSILKEFTHYFTSNYHQYDSDPESQQKLLKSFEENQWPLIKQYQELTGEQIYPTNSQGEPQPEKETSP